MLRNSKILEKFICLLVYKSLKFICWSIIIGILFLFKIGIYFNQLLILFFLNFTSISLNLLFKSELRNHVEAHKIYVMWPRVIIDLVDKKAPIVRSKRELNVIEITNSVLRNIPQSQLSTINQVFFEIY